MAKSSSKVWHNRGARHVELWATEKTPYRGTPHGFGGGTHVGPSERRSKQLLLSDQEGRRRLSIGERKPIKREKEGGGSEVKEASK